MRCSPCQAHLLTLVLLCQCQIVLEVLLNWFWFVKLHSIQLEHEQNDRCFALGTIAVQLFHFSGLESQGDGRRNLSFISVAP